MGDTWGGHHLVFASQGDIVMPSDDSLALEIKTSSDLHIRFITTDGGEKVQVVQNLEAQGTLDVTDALTVGGGVNNFYRAVNSGNPEIHLGASTAEDMYIQTVYDGSAQTLNYVAFVSRAASGTADKGEFRFMPDEVLVLTIEDGGIEVVGGITATTTLDVTGNVTLATLTSGTWQGTAIANAYVVDLPASKIDAGTFGTGDYTFPNEVTVNGQSDWPVFDHGAGKTANWSIDANDGNIQEVLISGSTADLTSINNWSEGSPLHIFVKWSGDFGATFDMTTVDWGSAGEPGWSSQAGKTDWVMLIKNGTKIYGAGAVGFTS
jgi:hypothetical protein